MTERTKAQIGRSSRRKGQVGERALAAELSALLGVEIKRRVRNHAGENDLTGLNGWSPEVKTCASPAMSSWWAQTVEQTAENEWPVLFYKLPRKPFKAVVPLAAVGIGEVIDPLELTIELTLEGFAALYRENEAIGLKMEQDIKNHALSIGVKLQ